MTPPPMRHATCADDVRDVLISYDVFLRVGESSSQLQTRHGDPLAVFRRLFLAVTSTHVAGAIYLKMLHKLKQTLVMIDHVCSLWESDRVLKQR